ncbi:MAG: exodeoxyribonuclease III [Gammaproteobacteria bacterium]|nr:exodeoxyribonuclease III [Gammaproteobacteria bacterium]
MRIITANVNGIRAAARHGFFKWLSRQRADVVCLQETKAQIHQLTDPVFHPKGFECHYHDAEKKGYSGTAIFCKTKPRAVQTGIGEPWFDSEGRYLEARFGNVTIVSLYLPSGTTGDIRQDYKYQSMDLLEKRLIALRRKKNPVVICGDWNIAHTEADIRNWKGNLKNSGFLPEERQWLSKVFSTLKYTDAFRVLPQKEHEYTWWSARGGARDNNVGWRIDYQVISNTLADKVAKTRIYRKDRFSDHAPLIIDYSIDIES